MWVTFYALATAVAVWFSATNFAIQLDKSRAAFNNAAIERPEQAPVAPSGSIEIDGA